MCSHLLFGVFVQTDPQLLTPLVKPLVEPLLGGTLDVAVFFVLSGDALSASYWKRRSRHDVVKLAIKRYFRLALPIAASCLIVFALITCGLTFHHQAAPLLNVDGWLGQFLLGDFSLLDMVEYAGFGVFCCHTPERSLNPFLGTMQVELVGSFLAFLYLLLDARIRWKYVALLGASCALLAADSFLACFPFGVLCGLFRTCGGFDRLRRHRIAQPLAILSVCIALVAGTYGNRVWPGWLLPSIVAACMIVFGIYTSRALSGLFSRPFARWLGRISFPLYLVHFPVLVSFTSGAVVLAHAHGCLGPATMWPIILCSVVLSMMAAVVFLPVETLTVRIGDLIYLASLRCYRAALRTLPPHAKPVIQERRLIGA